MKRLLFPLLSLAMVLAGYFTMASLARSTPPVDISVPEPAEKKPEVKIDPAAQERIDALRKRVRELEASIASRAAAKTQEPEIAPSEKGKPTRHEMMMRQVRGKITKAQYMNWLQKNDPAFFVTHTNEIAVSQQRSVTAARMRLDLFARLDESKLDADALAVHRECQAVCEELEKLAEIQKDPYLELDVLRKLNQEENRLKSRLEALYPGERVSLVRQYVRELGYGDDDQVERTILEILNNTTGDVIVSD